MQGMYIICTVFMCTFVMPCMCLKELRVVNLLPMDNPGWSGGVACLPAVYMAIEDVNAHPNILPGYNLTYKYKDSQCSAGTALNQMFEALYMEPPYVMLMGPPCSTSAEATAQVSFLWNLTQLTFGASSPILSDKKRFPNFYRMGTPDPKYTQARIDIMKMFGWTKIATIHQAVEFFSVVVDDLVGELNKNNITIITQEIFMHNPRLRVQNLKAHDARIIYVAAYEDRTKAILCEAYKIGLYGPKIVWMIMGWYSLNFWRYKLEDVDCTEEQMTEVVEGSFIFIKVNWNPVPDERGIANLTVSEFRERIYKHPMYDPNYQHYDKHGGSCYDQIWIAALALNCTVARLEEIGHPKTLDMFNYSDDDINKIIFECMAIASLVGVSGRISFENGDPDKIVNVRRIQDGQIEQIAYYRQDLRPQYFEWIEGALRWKDDKIPRDSTYVIFEEAVIPDNMYIPMCCFAALGIILAACFFVFNINYRSNKIVKLSSPNMNNVLLFGCVLCYITIFFKTTETANATICKARVMCFCLGFTITFGSLFSKTWRVYRIFTNKKLLRMSIKDIQLLGIVLVLVSVVLSVLVVWEIIEPHVMVVKYLDKEIYTIGNDIEMRPFVRVCQSNLSLYFAWAIYLIEGALLTFGAFLAWETRHVKIEALNDSQQIGMCLYNVVILSAVGLTLSLLLDEQVVMLYGVTSGCLIIGTTLTQCFVFLPKIYTVFGKVDVKTVVVSAPGTSADTCTKHTDSKPNADSK